MAGLGVEATFVDSADGCNAFHLPAESVYALDRSGVEAALRKLVASWKARAAGHEMEAVAPIAFKYAISFNREVTAFSGGIPLVKTWEHLRGSFREASEEAFELPKWTLAVPPLAPRTMRTIVIPGLTRIQAADPVIEVFCPEQAEKTFGRTTLHFFRKRDAQRFLGMTLRDME